MSQEMLNADTWSSPQIREAFPSEPDVMSYGGVAIKTGFLLAVTVALAAVGWISAASFVGRGSGLVYLLGYILLIALTVMAVNNPRLALAASLLYAVLNGLWLGAISRYYDEVLDGIVGLALLGTLAITVAMLILYASRAFRVTARVVQVIGALTLGVAVLYLVGFIFSLFGADLDFLYGYSPTAIAIGVIILAIAASNLLVDFANVELGVKSHAPKAAEWYAAFGVISTLVWLYLEVLRLLARVAAARQN